MRGQIGKEQINLLFNNAFAGKTAKALLKGLPNLRLEQSAICVIDYGQIGV